jgi:hypothetical protein
MLFIIKMLLLSLMIFRKTLIISVLFVLLNSLLWGQSPRLITNLREISLQVQKVNWAHKIKKANFALNNSSGLFESYRTTLCLTPKTATPPDQCIKAYLGAFLPSAMYIKVETGGIQMIQIVSDDTGWQVIHNPHLLLSTDTLNQKPMKLDFQQYNALREQAQHSLLALYEILNSDDVKKFEKLTFVVGKSYLIIKWVDGLSENDFFFNKQSLICEKQVRSGMAGVSVLKYSNYKKSNGVKLPYRIGLFAEAGKMMGVQEVEKWELGVLWPKDFFTPEGAIRDF